MSARETAVTRLEAAVAGGMLTPSAAEHLTTWLTEPPFAPYVDSILKHIEQQQWRELDDAFWTVIPFGTGGRRGKMYPIGTNTINDRTIGESAQGLADYVRAQAAAGTKLACAIAYDTRHRSEHFARLCAEVMAASGIQVHFLNGFRSTPELSFAVRYRGCHCGIMVTASHNPPSDNAVKVYWSSGGQILPPHDRGVIERVMAVQEIERTPFDPALADGRIVFCEAEIDQAYVQAVVAQAQAGPRDLGIVYSPLHGVGATAVCPVLAADGFNDVQLYGPHAEPDGSFPNVPGHVANPENPQVFSEIIKHARQRGADLVLASDPDCDRIGCAAPLGADASGDWAVLNGNQIGALLAEFLLSRRASVLGPEHYVVKTLVTTDLIRRIGDAYGVKTYGDLLVGFRWIAGMIDQAGADKFVFGTEESHGYLAGSYCRDKDGALAAMLLAELAASLKAAGQSLHQKLEAIFWQYGAHEEKTVSVAMPGSQGMQQMASLMDNFRRRPPRTLAGLEVVRVRDYENGVQFPPGAARERCEPLAGPRGDLVMIDLAEEGNYVAVRPSGTEPKVKYYMFTFTPPEQLADLADSRRQLQDRLRAMESDLRSYSESV